MTQERRTASPELRKKGERRADMKIITSASQSDIYVWAMSLVFMAIILVTVTLLAFMKG
ncbi:MAG: hypothetical protein OSB62_09110 [Alphaproteobacteria bacterium]|nr:hypothetical protein [Alphaproteobacteria bacterium]